MTAPLLETACLRLTPDQLYLILNALREIPDTPARILVKSKLAEAIYSLNLVNANDSLRSMLLERIAIDLDDAGSAEIARDMVCLDYSPNDLQEIIDEHGL